MLGGEISVTLGKETTSLDWNAVLDVLILEAITEVLLDIYIVDILKCLSVYIFN